MGSTIGSDCNLSAVDYGYSSSSVPFDLTSSHQRAGITDDLTSLFTDVAGNPPCLRMHHSKHRSPSETSLELQVSRVGVLCTFCPQHLEARTDQWHGGESGRGACQLLDKQGPAEGISQPPRPSNFRSLAGLTEKFISPPHPLIQWPP